MTHVFSEGKQNKNDGGYYDRSMEGDEGRDDDDDLGEGKEGRRKRLVDSGHANGQISGIGILKNAKELRIYHFEAL